MSVLKPEWFGGNTEARDMCEMMLEITSVWDDLIDKDKPVSESDINRVFLQALVYLPSNRFYVQYQSAFIVMWQPIVASWMAANDMELNNSGLEISYILRCLMCMMVVQASIICLGFKTASRHTEDIWRTMIGGDLNEYLAKQGG